MAIQFQCNVKHTTLVKLLSLRDKLLPADLATLYYQPQLLELPIMLNQVLTWALMDCVVLVISLHQKQITT